MGRQPLRYDSADRGSRNHPGSERREMPVPAQPWNWQPIVSPPVSPRRHTAKRVLTRVARAAVVVAAATTVGVWLTVTDAAGDQHEPSPVDGLLAPIAPAAPEEAPPADPGLQPPPDDGAAEEPEAAPAPSPEGEPAPAEPAAEPAPVVAPPEAPPPADVQASGEQGPGVAPRRPTAGSASTPRINTGAAPDSQPEAGFAAPAVAPPEAAPPEPAPAPGDRPSGEILAATPYPVPEQPIMPELAVLALVAAGLAWFDRRYRARYRLPPL